MARAMYGAWPIIRRAQRRQVRERLLRGCGRQQARHRHRLPACREGLPAVRLGRPERLRSLRKAGGDRVVCRGRHVRLASQPAQGNSASQVVVIPSLHVACHQAAPVGLPAAAFNCRM